MKNMKNIREKLIFNYLKFYNTSFLRSKFEFKFRNNKYHQWIYEDKYLSRCFDYLISTLNRKSLLKFLSKDFPIFLRCNGHMSCIVSPIKNKKMILVFPELFQLLKSAGHESALAILAHELGHLYHGHGDTPVNYIKAQIEADDFAFHLGMGLELQDVLSRYDNIECRTRIAYLASKHAYNIQEKDQLKKLKQ